MSMFVVEFNSNMNPYESSFLKVKLPSSNLKLSEQLEFELYLEGIEHMPGLDVTANWKSWDLNNTGGLFYTDSNAFEIMRRHSDNYAGRYNDTNTQRASSNYYPVNSAIFIEDLE